MPTLLALLMSSLLLTASAGARDSWVLDVSRLRGAAPVAVYDVGGHLLVEDDGAGLSAIDPATGRVLWFVRGPGRLDHRPMLSRGRIVLVSGDRVLEVTASEGERTHGGSLRSLSTAAPASNEAALFVPEVLEGRLSALPRTGGLALWHFDVPGGVIAPVLMTGSAGNAQVIVLGGDGVLRSLPAGRATPRRESWTARTGRLATVPVLAGAHVITASRDGRITARTANVGQVAWERVLGQPATGGLIVGDDYVLVPLASGVIALERSTGVTRWESSGSTKALGALGSRVLLLDGSGSPRLHDAATGEAGAALPKGTRAFGEHLVRVDGAHLAGVRAD